MDRHARPQADEIRWPCSLPASTQTQLLKIARHYDPAQLGGNLPGVLYVASGCLIGYATHAGMENSLGLIFGRGSWFGTQYIHNPTYTPVEFFEPLLPTELILFPKEELEPLLEQDPHLYKFLFYIAQYMGRLAIQMGSNSLYCLTTRTVYVLLELATKHALANDREPSLEITQQTLSRIIGISRPRLNEVLKQLAAAGELRLGRGEITLLDMAALKTRLPPLGFTYHDPAPHTAQEDAGARLPSP